MPSPPIIADGFGAYTPASPYGPDAWKDLETFGSKLTCSNSHFLFSGTTLVCFYLKTG